ncbi:hypothetical protein ASE63_05975 [Bosea sp. Root381]|uniref:pyrroloquinoline quinone biosynthesis protein PqqB n=1 Tax=Bosea sp. Root381 TaxID=1736524 RepID=UPI0006FB93A4|nr:pyrroloquinoline quinone biosynthesis protein PqqB [Bosea sp. Root381]KRE05866.1 hypothetical protein ASE63_05975 [Bosea sp. Root381]
MKVVVLGSGAGGGFPQWNCRCPNCALAWAGDPRAPWRTQSSIALVDDDEAVLVDASPDLRQQLAAIPALHPTAARTSPLRAVVLTSGEIDHIAGLAHLREARELTVLGTAPVLEAIASNVMFRLPAIRHVAVTGEPIATERSFRMRLFPAPGKVPLYLEEESVATAIESGETSGLAVESRGGLLVYIPGCAMLSETVRQEAERADIVLFDGTLFTDDEMLAAGLSAKTGRRMGHMPMTGPGGSLDWLASLPAARKVYTHINNSNPVLISHSPERRRVESAGIEIAHDGMEIAL